MNAKTLMLTAWRGAVTLTLAGLVWHQATLGQKAESPTRLTAQRLDIVEPDGKPRVVISSRAQMPTATYHGKVYSHQSHAGGGFLFFNSEGSEAGGMGFAASRDGDQFQAQSNLNFDQYNQDNVLQLIYTDDNGQRVAGLRVKDRPDESIVPALELVDRINSAKDAEDKRAFEQQLQALADRYAKDTATRFFAGKELNDSIVRLADQRGRPRLVLKVDGEGGPSIEFLDETGAVIRRLPTASSTSNQTR